MLATEHKKIHYKF